MCAALLFLSAFFIFAFVMIVEGRVSTFAPFHFLLYPPLLLLSFRLYGGGGVCVVGEALRKIFWKLVD